MTHGTVVVEGVGAVDNSPPEHIPHEEYSGVERTKARILLPDSVKALRNEVYELKTRHSKELVEMAKELGAVVSVNTELVKEVKVLSSTVKDLVDALHGVTQQKLKGPAVTVAPTQNIELNRIYE